MTDILIGGDVKKLETNCNKKLSGFVGKLNQYSNTMKKHSAELKLIAADLVVRSQQLQKLENIKPENLKCYSVDQRDRVLSEILCQANVQVITANRLITELEDFHRELKAEYRNLSALANVLQITTAESFLLVGDCRQKPITYYLENACQVLHIWMLYQRSLHILLNRIDMRNDDSIRQFETMTPIPQHLSANLDRYLLFSTFLLAQK
ncbi:uncharacterized protein LOC129568992 [Sitodiplosis mosellana]|uniref:uncharacterized protein LOC129568992 n=1 Tax=Sitodiplosis mosellana TaxID=263140 RepID=UPI0024450CFD|nr:uncharacterized protein LOC129568992 [Sitodiplosis mosellana]